MTSSRILRLIPITAFAVATALVGATASLAQSPVSSWDAAAAEDKVLEFANKLDAAAASDPKLSASTSELDQLASDLRSGLSRDETRAQYEKLARRFTILTDSRADLEALGLTPEQAQELSRLWDDVRRHYIAR